MSIEQFNRARAYWVDVLKHSDPETMATNGFHYFFEGWKGRSESYGAGNGVLVPGPELKAMQERLKALEAESAESKRLWAEHQRSKFKNDGSHFQADQKLNQHFGVVDVPPEPSGTPMAPPTRKETAVDLVKRIQVAIAEAKKNGCWPQAFYSFVDALDVQELTAQLDYHLRHADKIYHLLTIDQFSNLFGAPAGAYLWGKFQERKHT